MDDVEYFATILARLRALGVRLAIDDFGTGYSSLSYLKRFPVDEVKVDRSFIDGLGTDPHSSALVAAIIAMADALGLEVTAEGVESASQLVDLERLHCRRAQGFYLARPMLAADVTRLVADSKRWPIAHAATTSDADEGGSVDHAEEGAVGVVAGHAEVGVEVHGRRVGCVDVEHAGVDTALAV
jgi:predicted signal transduction protein with EAL and GGDEF domain